MLFKVMFNNSFDFHCQGLEVQLDQDCLAFGAVVQRCQVKKRIVMMNRGDIGAR